MTKNQRKNLRKFVFVTIWKEFIKFSGLLISVALLYVILYFINGGLGLMTEADLPKLTVHVFSDWITISFDDFGLKYSLSGWWNILFLTMWLNLMRYLLNINDSFKFPYSNLDYSGYSLLVALTAAMAYFSWAGTSFLYGFMASVILLAFYTLTHILICFLMWFLGIERA